MAAGFQVINDSGILQIDENYKNMVLTGRGQIGLSRPGGNGAQPYPSAAYYYISYPVASRQPVLALRSNGNCCFLTDDNGFTIFGATGVVVDYYIYDQIAFGNANGNTGMQVFNGSGVEVFNSNNNYMKILSAYDVNLVIPNIGTNPSDVPTYSGSAPAGRTLAVCMAVQSTGYYVAYSGTGQGQAVINVRYWQCQVVTPAANTFTLSNTVIHAFGGPSAPGQNSGAAAPYNSGMIIDVTGL